MALFIKLNCIIRIIIVVLCFQITLDELPLLKKIREILPLAFAVEIKELERKEVKFRKRKNEGGVNSKFHKGAHKNSGKRKCEEKQLDTKKLKLPEEILTKENG